MKKEVNVCLTWHNLDSSNYGVGALAVSQVAILLEIAKKNNININIETLGTKPTVGVNVRSEIEKRFNIEINHHNFNLKDFVKTTSRFDKKWFKLFSKFDLVIDIGEGDSFSDIYGWRRYCNLTATKIITIINKTPLVLAPQTIGPFKHKIFKYLSKFLMVKAKAVYSRDFKTSAFLNNLNIDYAETSDIAFQLPYDEVELKRNTIGINVSGLLWNGGYNRNNQFGLGIDYKKSIFEIIDGCIKRGKEVHLVAHVIDDNLAVEDDYRVCRDIYNKYNSEKVVLAPKFNSPIEVKSYIASLEFFTGSRMHATIAAISSGVPTVPIAYSRKFSGVFGSLDYGYTLDIFDGKKIELSHEFFKLYDNNIKEMKAKAILAKNTSLNKNKKYLSSLEKEILNVIC